MSNCESNLPMLTHEINQLRELRRQYPERTQFKETVSIIAPTNKLYFMSNIFFNFQQQNYINKELILVLNNNQLNLEDWSRYCKNIKNTRIYQLDESTELGECINFAIKQANGAYICKFDDDDYYSPNFISDLMPCFLTTNAAIVGKNVHYVYFESLAKLYIIHENPGYSFVNAMPGGAQIIKREVFNNVRFANISIGEDCAFIEECVQKGYKLYGADPFNYVSIRHSSPTIHTWKVTDQEYINCLKFIDSTTDYKTIINV